MDILAEQDILFSIWMSNNHAVIKQAHDAHAITWEVLVEFLNRAHAAGLGDGISRVMEQIDVIESSRREQ